MDATEPDEAAPAPRGRRPHIAPDDIARMAMSLFEARGYDDTSTDDVAAHANVSRRSLFRYFPSKANLVWHGFEPYLTRLSVLIDEGGHDGDPFDAVQEALVAALPTSAPDIAAMRVQLSIIDRHPELWSVGSPSLLAARDLLRGFLTRRTEFDELEVLILAEATITATFTALRFWATADEGLLEQVLRSAFGALAGWGAGPGGAEG
jgi:AcrR family transcriptional regulator